MYIYCTCNTPAFHVNTASYVVTYICIIFYWNRGTIIVAPSPERTSGLLLLTSHDVYGILHFDPTEFGL
jgi:hypothetical protein